MEEKLKYKIRSVVEKLGVEQSLNIFGEDILKQVYMDNPSTFLNQFNNLKPVKKDNRVYYIDNDSETLFYYAEEDLESGYGFYYINYYRIWSFFSDIMGYNSTKTKQIIKEWLGTTYNLMGLTPSTDLLRQQLGLGTTYN